MLKTTLSAPWDAYYKQINEMFRRDDDVRVVYDPEEYKIKLYVEDQDKAEALNILIKPEAIFGNVTLKIEVVPPNDILRNIDSLENLHKIAFRENKAVSYIKVFDGAFKATYVVFEKEVVQYFNDDLSSIGRVCSTLYETIAKDIFKEAPGVFFCTDTDDPGEDSITPYRKWLKSIGDLHGSIC